MPSGRSQDARSTLPAMSFVCPDSKITRVTHHVRERVRVCVCVCVCRSGSETQDTQLTKH